MRRPFSPRTQADLMRPFGVVSAEERRQAEQFYLDLMGGTPPRSVRRSVVLRGNAVGSAEQFYLDLMGGTPPRSARESEVQEELARQAGPGFTPDGKTRTQRVTVMAAEGVSDGVYRTIQEVIDDPKAVRRQAMLARIAEYFPAFNTYESKDGKQHGAGFKKGDDSGILNQGPWINTFSFDGLGSGTSCTSVNAGVVAAPVVKNNSTRWAFDAGPEGKGGPNPGWVASDKDHIPSVGDVYILRNLAYGYGHVGFVVHVPPNGNGLWVTADGGQGSKPVQLAILVPRWGLMGAMLPAGGTARDPYKKLQPQDDGPPWLSGATAGVIHADAPVPQQNDDVAGIIQRIKFIPSNDLAKPSNPRRIAGYVNVDSPKLKFDIDGKAATADMISACKTLQEKVNKVIASYLAGHLVGGAQS